MARLEDVIEVLKQVRYPGLKQDIVGLGYVKEVGLEDGRLQVRLEIQTTETEAVKQIELDTRAALEAAGHEFDLTIETPRPADAPEGGAPGVSPLTGGAVNADGQFEILVPAGQNAVLVVYQDANGNNRQDADETMLIANSGASLSTAADKTVNFSCTDDRVGGPMGEQSGDDAKPKQGEAAPE